MNELVQSKIKCYIIAGSNGAGKTTFAENFLKLPSEEMAVKRVQLRVAQGGHNVPKNVIIRRYHRGWENFQKYYKHLVDVWVIFDNSGDIPSVLEEKI